MERAASSSLRERILEEAITIVRREGAGGITMRSIARKLGYSPATLYLYVPSKEALLQKVALHGFRLLGEAVAPAREIEDPEQAVVEVSRGFLEFALRDPHLYRLMFEKLDLARYRDDPSPGVPGRVLFDAMAALLQRGVDAGVFRGMDPSIQAVSYWCTLHGFAMLVLDGRMPPPRLGHLSLDELKASLLESVRRSLGH